jgi:hypothetical protein
LSEFIKLRPVDSILLAAPVRVAAVGCELQQFRVEGFFQVLDRAQLQVRARSFKLGVSLLGEA